MASKNQLLGSGRVVEERVVETVVDEKVGWPMRFYHASTPAGKVFYTKPEQNIAKLEGWVESPAELTLKQADKIIAKKEKVKAKAKAKKE